jgi:hypothetical protein
MMMIARKTPRRSQLRSNSRRLKLPRPPRRQPSLLSKKLLKKMMLAMMRVMQTMRRLRAPSSQLSQRERFPRRRN